MVHNYSTGLECYPLTSFKRSDSRTPGCRQSYTGMKLSEVCGAWRLQSAQQWRTYISTCRKLTCQAHTCHNISTAVAAAAHSPSASSAAATAQTAGVLAAAQLPSRVPPSSDVLAAALDEQWMWHGTSFQVEYPPSQENQFLGYRPPRALPAVFLYRDAMHFNQLYLA